MKILVKTLSILIISSIPFLSFAQSEKPIIPEENLTTKQFENKTIFEFDSTAIPINIAYERSLKYIYKYLQNDKTKVISDIEKHDEIIAECTIKGEIIEGFRFGMSAPNYTFTLNVSFKNGKFKLYFYNFIYTYIAQYSNAQVLEKKELNELKDNKPGKKVKLDLSGKLYLIQEELLKSVKGENIRGNSENDW